MSKEEILEQCGFPADYYKSVENMDMGKHSTTPLAPALKAMEEYAQQEAFLFFEFKKDYHRIEGMNVKHYCDEKFDGNMISWVGADDKTIWEAYKKGEQLKRYYEK